MLMETAYTWTVGYASSTLAFPTVGVGSSFGRASDCDSEDLGSIPNLPSLF